MRAGQSESYIPLVFCNWSASIVYCRCRCLLLLHLYKKLIRTKIVRGRSTQHMAFHWLSIQFARLAHYSTEFLEPHTLHSIIERIIFKTIFLYYKHGACVFLGRYFIFGRLMESKYKIRYRYERIENRLNCCL